MQVACAAAIVGERMHSEQIQRRWWRGIREWWHLSIKRVKEPFALVLEPILVALATSEVCAGFDEAAREWSEARVEKYRLTSS